MALYSEMILYCILTAAGLAGALSCLQFQFYDAAGLPGPGFFPVVIGGMIAVLSVIALVGCLRRFPSSEKKMDRGALQRVTLFLALLVALAMLGQYIVGLLPALGVFMAAALIIWDKTAPAKAVLVAVVLLVLVGMAFSVLLNVQFPMGLFD